MCLGYADVVPYCLAKIVQMSGMMARKALGFTCLTPECRLILWKDSANERNDVTESLRIYVPHSRVPPYLMER